MTVDERFAFLKGHGTENDFVLLPDPDGTRHGDLSVAERGDQRCVEVTVRGAVGVGQQHEVVLRAVALEEADAHTGDSRLRAPPPRP